MKRMRCQYGPSATCPLPYVFVPDGVTDVYHWHEGGAVLCVEAEAQPDAVRLVRNAPWDATVQQCGHFGCKLRPGHVPGHTDR